MTGKIQIATDDISLHGTSIELTVRAVDPQSKSAKSFAETTATVHFFNPCFNTMIFQEELIQTTFTANLWQPIFYQIPMAFSSEDCGAITYYLTGLSQPEPFEVTTHEGNLGFWIRATEPDQVQTWNWSLNSCITINDNNQVCNTQSGLKAIISDTCPDTQIISEPINATFVVKQGSTNTNNFRFGVWAWADTVGFSDSVTYGKARCGTKSYEVRDAFGNIVDWVSVMADGTLKVQPGLDVVPMYHELTLTVYMDDYVNSNGDPIYASQPFGVTVILCEPMIDVSDSNINDVFYHRWGSP